MKILNFKMRTLLWNNLDTPLNHQVDQHIDRELWFRLHTDFRNPIITPISTQLYIPLGNQLGLEFMTYAYPPPIYSY